MAIQLDDELKRRFQQGSVARLEEEDWRKVIDATSVRSFMFSIMLGLLPPGFSFRNILVQIFKSGEKILFTLNIRNPASLPNSTRREDNWLSLRLNILRLARGNKAGLQVDVPRMDVHELEGGAKKVFHNLLPLFNEIGVQHITLEADEVGSYTWVRYGFRPDGNEWKRLRAILRDELEKLLPGFAYVRNYETAKRILKLSDPDAIRQVADLQDANFPSPQGLGYRLLQKKIWKGSLDLTDRTRVDELKLYIKYQEDRVWAGRSVAGPALDWA